MQATNPRAFKSPQNARANDERGYPIPHPALSARGSLALCGSFSTKQRRKYEISFTYQDQRIGAYAIMQPGVGLCTITFHPVVTGVYLTGRGWERCNTDLLLAVPPVPIFSIFDRYLMVALQPVPWAPMYVFGWGGSVAIVISGIVYETWGSQVQWSRSTNIQPVGSHNYLNE